MGKEKLFLVPEQWLSGLLEKVAALEEANKKWEYGESSANSKVHFEAVSLAGYAKSATSILRFNESVEK